MEGAATVDRLCTGQVIGMAAQQRSAERYTPGQLLRSDLHLAVIKKTPLGSHGQCHFGADGALRVAWLIQGSRR